MGRCRSDISIINGGFRKVGLEGAGYDVGFKFARGGISVATVTLVLCAAACRQKGQNSSRSS